MGVRTSAVTSNGSGSRFQVRDIVVDDPRPDEVLVRVVATGVCHTDLVVRDLMPGGSPDFLLGHEGAGVVEAVGAAVSGVRVGDHVVLTVDSCGRCSLCVSGRPAYCEEAAALNRLAHRPDGSATVVSETGPVLAGFFGQSSFAGHALGRARNTVVVDGDVDLATVAAFGCGFQTGAGAMLNVLAPDPAASVVVYGAGSVGLAALLSARMLGVGTIVAVDPIPQRRALAAEFGAVPVDPSSEAVAEQIRDATNGGATHAVDTSGRPDVIRGAMLALRRTGTLVVVGLGPSQLDLDVQDVMLNGKSLRGCVEGDAVPHAFIPELVRRHVAGDLPVDRLVTRYPFERVNEAVADQESGAVVKPVLLWP